MSLSFPPQKQGKCDSPMMQQNFSTPAQQMRSIMGSSTVNASRMQSCFCCPAMQDPCSFQSLINPQPLQQHVKHQKVSVQRSSVNMSSLNLAEFTHFRVKPLLQHVRQL